MEVLRLKGVGERCLRGRGLFSEVSAPKKRLSAGQWAHAHANRPHHRMDIFSRFSSLAQSEYLAEQSLVRLKAPRVYKLP
jgi:hypothetical protein